MSASSRVTESRTRILLVRHGETAHNAAGRCQGRLDVSMSARGEMQIRRLAISLEASGALRELSAAYTSPLARSWRAAQMLMDARVDEHVTAIVEDADLVELDYGSWQGTTPLEWPPGAHRQWQLDPWSMTFPDGESLAAVRTRAHRALARITAAHPGQCVLVSSHGHINRVILLDALRHSPLDFWSIRQRNADAWWITCTLNSDGLLEFLSAERVEALVTETTAQRAIDGKTKPIGALGVLEATAVRLARLQQTLSPRIEAARICVFGADHGVTEEGVSAYPRAVTAEMMRNFARGGAAINVLARANALDVEVVDVGVDADLPEDMDIRHARVRRGSRNLLHEAALSVEELDAALAVGAEAVQRAVRAGVDVIGLGEMGIGNTTAAAALLSALTGQSSSRTVGSGTGVHGEALAHKRAVVDGALARHGTRTTIDDRALSARECLRRLGGLELAAMAGATLAAKQYPIVILADGFISTVSVLAAICIDRETGGDAQDGANIDGRATALMDRIFLSHRSTETGHAIAIDALATLAGRSLRPLLDLDMRLGEGTGAALAVPLLRSAAAIMTDMATFSEAGVSTGDHEAAHGTTHEAAHEAAHGAAPP